MPVVSVIIPAFNAERLFAVALASAQAQTVRDIEILVVDDASTDGTAALAEAAGRHDPRVRLLRHGRNQGPGAARNTGLDAAEGRFVALLDADDAYVPERLDRLLAAADEQHAQLVADNLMLVQAPAMDRIGPMFPPVGLNGPVIITSEAFVVGNVRRRGRARREYGFLKPLIDREFLVRTGLRYEPMRFSEDYLFALRCLLAGARYVLLPEAFYDYTVSPAGLTVGHSADDLAILARAERALLGLPEVLADHTLHGAIERHVRSVDLALAWFSFATALKQRRPAMAARHALRSPAHLRHIGQEGLRALPRALSHLLGKPA